MVIPNSRRGRRLLNFHTAHRAGTYSRLFVIKLLILCVFFGVVYFLGGTRFFGTARFLGVAFFGGLPPTRGTKASISDRRTNFLSPISMHCNLPCCISLRIRSCDTPRTRAASAWEIQSLRSSPKSNLPVELFNSFCYDP